MEASRGNAERPLSRAVASFLCRNVIQSACRVRLMSGVPRDRRIVLVISAILINRVSSEYAYVYIHMCMYTGGF